MHPLLILAAFTLAAPVTYAALYLLLDALSDEADPRTDDRRPCAPC